MRFCTSLSQSVYLYCRMSRSSCFTIQRNSDLWCRIEATRLSVCVAVEARSSVRLLTEMTCRHGKSQTVTALCGQAVVRKSAVRRDSHNEPENQTGTECRYTRFRTNSLVLHKKRIMDTFGMWNDRNLFTVQCAQ